MKMIEDANQSANLLKMKISRFKKVFKTLELWAGITTKLAEIVTHKATPGAIKEMMEIVKLAKYPQ